MNVTRGPLLGLLSLALVLAVAGQGMAQETHKLSYKPYQKWNILTPQEVWSPVSGSVPVPHAGGSGFDTAIDGAALAVDTTGDGRVDDKIRGVGGFALLRSKSDEGRPFAYAVRFKNEGGWKYASSGVMLGRVHGVPVQLIDLNNNGIWNEYGTDAMVVGRSRSASYLSRVVNLRGELYEFEVTENGHKATTKPYEGATGSLNLRAGFKSYGQLKSAVVANTAGDISFELARARRGMEVPTGEYVLVGGMAAKGGESARIRQGHMSPIVVKEEEESKLEWGAQVTAEFDFNHSGENITISPSSLSFYGAAGEEYYGWVPDGASPKFIVLDKESGAEVTTGRFGGC